MVWSCFRTSTFANEYLKDVDVVLVENWKNMLNNYDVKVDEAFKDNREFVDFVDLILNKLIDSSKFTTHYRELNPLL